ncbi:hypothetical protein KW842_05265 [Duganella sp. sic0402]|uniref:hypothetical protein n=1 Tax=Duganella sp. sic0402 TaxID=2854786 RepID=UPI001C43D860|nr:hypothetical protein [Duganella sp. sic0402]MBV7535177.1 hypothetical protein [Duganella sp. sic0402]
MSQPNKPDPRGFKPGANMPQDGYDPKKQGMSDSGNHATGHPGNDNPHASQQSAAAAATAATHRDKKAGARGDDYSDTNRKGNR